MLKTKLLPKTPFPVGAYVPSRGRDFPERSSRIEPLHQIDSSRIAYKVGRVTPVRADIAGFKSIGHFSDQTSITTNPENSVAVLSAFSAFKIFRFSDFPPRLRVNPAPIILRPPGRRALDKICQPGNSGEYSRCPTSGGGRQIVCAVLE
jgi:hypothetical protein